MLVYLTYYFYKFVIYFYIMINIFIGTTAINRPELHKTNIESWVKWFSTLDKELYKINWIINIDIVDKLSASWDETKESFEQIITSINPDICLTFLSSPTNKGNFLQACKRVSKKIIELVESNNLVESITNTKIIWLEDDWKWINGSTYDLNDLITNYSIDKTYINLSFIRNNYIWALAPSIISYDLFYELFYLSWENQNEHIDPEHCVGLALRKIIDPELITNITVINKRISDDYFDQTFINLTNSFYTYYNDKFDIKQDDRYIKVNDIKDKFSNEYKFIRLSPKLAEDIGRSWMEKQNIFKNKQSSITDDFYTNK